MAIIGKLRYDADGDLLSPSPSDLRMTTVLFNTPVTTDPGHWHRIKVEGRSEQALGLRAAQVLRQLQAIEGLGIWQETKQTVNAVDGGTHQVIDLVYAVPDRR